MNVEKENVIYSKFYLKLASDNTESLTSLGISFLICKIEIIMQGDRNTKK
jgi:hypothetical protein